MVRLSSQLRVKYAPWYRKSLVHRMKSELSQLGQPKPMGMMQETQQATLGTKRIPLRTPKQNPKTTREHSDPSDPLKPIFILCPNARLHWSSIGPNPLY